jgi:ankyrin repeat protein
MKGETTPYVKLIYIDLASANGHVDIVKLLISYNIDINAQNLSGNTPLRIF